MAELQPLATVEQVSTLLRVDLPADDPGAQLLIGWASSLIRGHLERTITYVEGDVVTLTPRNGVLQLPEPPVTAVTKLERNDRPVANTWTTIDPADYTVDLERAQVYGTAGYNYYSGDPWWPTAWPTYPGGMRVTYNHGLQVVPDGIAAVVASIAARLYNTPPGILNERNGQRGATFRAEEFLTPIELMTLAPYREAKIA